MTDLEIGGMDARDREIGISRGWREMKRTID